jgi:polysaccharide biosynthesis protein VpsQ
MKWFTVFFALFIILIIVLADTGNLGLLYQINRIPHADKAGHLVLYGVLVLLINLTLFRSYPDRSRKWIAVSVGSILALLIGLEEFSQQLFADRTFSLADLSASYLGVALFTWLAVKVQK